MMKQILKEWRKYLAETKTEDKKKIGFAQGWPPNEGPWYKKRVIVVEDDNLEQHIYSFDFDNTLIRYETLEDGDVEYIGPHEENIALLKNLVEQGNKVIIVTSRSRPNKPKFEWDKAPTPEEAIQKFNLPVEEVHYTHGDLKADKLLELGVSKHWDDDDDEVAAAQAAGIEAILVDVEGDVTDRLRDKWLDHMAKEEEETN